MDRIGGEAVVQIFAPHMFTGRYDRAIAAQVEQPRLLLPIILPHRDGVQATASARVIVGQASRAEPPGARFDGGSPEGLPAADAGSGVNVRKEDRRGHSKQV